ncbi:MAG: UDP-N-acetylmuramoyl-tripeptide--D-alanyl-D-alanine ligase [Acidimicrobiia bacterium]|nr:UDP-N-acetylmuramoyl-tripeptide--D-alanyl-D-alanine ligase [Acidimicrobiia bacterium]
MSWTSWLVPVLSLAGIAVAAVKWLRVAQREHYLAGSILFMRRVWITGRPVNVLEEVMLAGALAGYALAPDSFWPLLGCLGIVIFPIGLGYRGRTSPLNWTVRLRRTASVGAILLALATALLGWMITIVLDGGWPGALAMAAVVSWYAIPDLGLWIAAPVERRLSEKFVVRAAGTLDRVAPVVVGITGSYGKTSTKWYVRDLLSGTKRVVASPASFNNRLGLARAINETLTDDAEVFVAEMGAYQPGEIADTCSWIPPSIAVLTAIGPVHLQRFKSEERIVEAKSEIFEHAEVAIVNVDHPALADLAGRLGDRKVWRCGTSEGATDVRVRQDGDLLTIVVDGRALGEPVPTGPFPANLACAVAVALEMGVPPAVVSDRTRRLAPTDHRQTTGRSEAGFEIIDDTFNSNPAGGARALEVLAGAGDPSGRRVVVTPGMVELGPRQHDANLRFAAAAAEVADHLVIVGRANRRALLRGARGGSVEVILVDNREQAVAWVRELLGPGDAVLYENDLPDHYP